MEDTDGFTLELIKNANTTLEHLNRENLTRWADSCAEQGGQIMNLTFEVYELLTPNAWTWEECNENVVRINWVLEMLGSLEKQFAKDQLNICQNYHEALKIQSDMNAESIEALRTIRRMATCREPDSTSDEEQEDETPRSGSVAINGTINTPGDSEKCAQSAPDLEVSQPCRPRPPEGDKGGDDDERGRQTSGAAPSPTPDSEIPRPCLPGPSEDDEEGDSGGKGQPSSGGVSSPSRDGSPSRRKLRIQRPKEAEPNPVLQGIVDCLTTISGQMLRLSSRSGKNGGWPWFDGTYREYPAFKRRWQDYEKNHLSLTTQQDRVQLLQEKCMSKEIGNYIKAKGSMPEA
jgi:hypothetical protein